MRANLAGLAQAADFAALLEAQRRDYGLAVPAKVASLAATAREALACGGRPESLLALEREAHTLAGSSGTFGFNATSVAARALEDAACELREAGAARIDRLASLIQQLLASPELA